MPTITNSVGDTGTNKTHDVSLVQAMLRVIKKNGAAYLGGNYDGSYGPITKKAITKFQNDYKLVGPKSADMLGKIMPNGETMKKMNASLPQAFNDMRVIANTKTVYIPGSTADYTNSKTSISNNQNLDATFRAKVVQMVQNVYTQHKIVLKVTGSGGLRTFQDQANINPANTGAGPGESNHNFGRAVDIGFGGFKWVQGNGTIKQDNFWLTHLAKASNAKATALWDARDAIALKAPISLFRLNFERIHLQSFNQAQVSSMRSLASLLTQVGTMTWAQNRPWQTGYKANLGKGKQLFPVGTARQIWAGNSTVSKADIAKSKGMPAAKITAKDITQMKAAVKADFQAAEANWKKWKPIA